MNKPEDLVDKAVRHLIEGRVDDARSVLSGIDFVNLLEQRSAARDAVWGPEGVGRGYQWPRGRVKREPVRAADQKAVFSRDRFTCRYAHCGRRTISLDVLKALSKALPDVLPYHSNWKPVERHALYWTYSTSLEHVVAFPDGGASAVANLITSCYLCNDSKNALPLEVLGWTVATPCGGEWDGLTGAVPELRRAVARLEGWT